MKIYLNIIFVLIANGLFAQYEGPVPAITSGYGANGTYPVSVINLTNDHWNIKDISIYYPTGTISPVPTIFYSHAYGGNDTANQIETLNHLASKGYAVVFVPYRTFGVTIPERYLTLYDGFVKAAENLTSIIDTSLIGFYGHSFGGGATPRISYRLFTEKNWGTNGKFIYCSAPWYSFELGTTNLDNFPTDCKMITVLYDDDEINDHRMGMDIFNNIAISDSIKDCIIVKTDTISGYIYQADHTMPTQYNGNSEFNAFDYYVTFRLLDALADFTFTGNTTAKNIALGNGSTAQINMGGQLSSLIVTDIPSPVYPETNYLFPCSSTVNERQSFCQSIVEIDDETFENNKMKIYPNPTSGIFTVKGNDIQSIEIININEQVVYSFADFNPTNEYQVDLTAKPKGVYFIKIQNTDFISVKKIVIQ